MNGVLALSACLSLPLAAQNTIYEYTVPSGGYSPTGNVLQYQENVAGTTGSWTLSYDPLNRLTNATSQSGPFQGTALAQQYDSFGNRLAQGVTSSGSNSANLPDPSWATYDSSGSQTCPYSGTNRLCTSDRAQGGLPTSAPDGMANGYDAAGNLLGDGIIRTRYDAEGRVCAVSSPSSPGVIQYIYDAEGTRVAKVSSNSFTCLGGAPDAASVSSRYIVGPSGEQVTELDGQNQWRHSNFFVGGAILATYDGNGVHFPLKDADGSLRVQVNGAATIDETCVSLPFGDGQNCSGSDISEHHYTGKERDTESGLDYFGARYYGSSMGRWVSPDLVNITEDRMLNPASTLNKYAYAADNPLRYTDPDGQDITYFYDPGGVAGHAILFAYNQATGDSATESFGPNIHLPIGIGVSSFDLSQYTSAQGIRDNFASVTIQTTPELTQQVIDYIRAHPDPSIWFMAGPDCSSEVWKILHKFKLDRQGFHLNQGLTPKILWTNLMARYNPSEYSLFPHPKQRHDYGNPRMDMFNLFWNSLPQAHERVSSKIVDWKPLENHEED